MAKGKVIQWVGRLFGIAPEADAAAEAARLAKLAETAELAKAAQAAQAVARTARLAAITEANAAVRGIHEEMSLANGLITGGRASSVTLSSILGRTGLASTNSKRLCEAMRAMAASAEGTSYAKSAANLAELAGKIDRAVAGAQVRAMEVVSHIRRGSDAKVVAEAVAKWTTAQGDVSVLMTEFENAAVAFEAEVGKEVIAGGSLIVAPGIAGSDPSQGRLPEHPMYSYFRPIINGGAAVADGIDTLVFGTVDLGATVVGQSIDSRASLENAMETGAEKLDRVFDQLEQETQSGFRKVENSIINNSGWGM
ncbi:MAG: hypothetical protein R3F23_01030 [Verrucomicrobiia bacterium]